MLTSLMCSLLPKTMKFAAEQIMLELDLINMESKILHIKSCNAEGRKKVRSVRPLEAEGG